MSLATVTDSRPGQDRDSGAILLLVLAVSIVLSMVVLALANFVMADLRYSQVVDWQAKRLASAQSGIDYAVDRLRLNQTLCATDVADGVPVSLNGSGSVGTTLPAALNGTNTTVTCERLDQDIADVAGWAVVIKDPLSGPSSRLQVTMTGDVPFGGPVFVRDPNRRATDTDSQIKLVDGDLWYTGTPNCDIPKLSSDLVKPSAPLDGLLVWPVVSRGPECTTRLWSEVFSTTPPIPTLPTIPDPLPDTTTFPGCSVFSPGLYNTVPIIPGAGTRHAYFKSGDYHLAFNAEWQIAHDTYVWMGHPGPLAGSEQVPNNTACRNARDADVLNGTGATFYFDGTSQIEFESNGNVEMFARQQGQYMVSVQALSGSSSSSTDPLIRTGEFGSVPTDLVIHGLVWAPDGWITFGNHISGSLQKLLGGIVVGGLWTLRVDLPNFEIKPATSTVDTRVLLKSTSTLGGVSTTVEAVVAYRPHATNLDDRVAVNSFRVVD